MLAVLANKQPFFNLAASTRSEKLSDLIAVEMAEGSTCVLFYEGIRTNGLGTIKISKKLST